MYYVVAIWAMYKNIASVYNMLGWDKFSLETADKLRPYLKKWKIKTHLDLGCGTGIFVNKISRLGIDSSGLDICRQMIAEAKKNFPNNKFYVGDMTNFYFKKKFDLITCLYDSINHLTALHQWMTVFKNVYKNLNKNGCFVFDFNTVSKMNAPRATTCQNQQTYSLATEHKPLGKNKREFTAEWHIAINKNRCTKRKFKVVEKSYPFLKIKESLGGVGFSKVSLLFARPKNPDLQPRLFVVTSK